MGSITPSIEKQGIRSDDGYRPEVKPASYSSRKFSEITEKRVNWLWPDNFATKTNVIGGSPGVGKSQISANFIATVTSGGRWPDGQPCEAGSAIIITSEDDAADTLKPRLLAAGADVSKVEILDGIFTADGKDAPWTLEHIDELEQLVIRQGDTRLIVVDPITAYLGKNKEGHSTAEVRGLLAPLQSLADKYQACVLMITHLNKSKGSSAGERFNGSTAWVAVSRSAWLVGEHPEDDTLRVIVPVKNNLGNDSSGFAYRIEGHRTESGIDTSRIAWAGRCEADADTVLNGPPQKIDDPVNQSAVADAARFLLEQLKEGPVKSTLIYSRSEDAEISESALKRAKKTLNIKSVRCDGGWAMTLAEKTKGVT